MPIIIEISNYTNRLPARWTKQILPQADKVMRLTAESMHVTPKDYADLVSAMTPPARKPADGYRYRGLTIKKMEG